MSERGLKSIPIRVEPGADLSVAERNAVRESLAANQSLQGALLPVLHGVQDRLGWVPPKVVPVIAFELNLSRAEVHGVLSFYHYFRQAKPGQKVIYLCRAEACQAVGAVELEAHAKRRLGIGHHGTTTDGRYTLEPVYCLGNCACGPSLMIDKDLHAYVTPARFDELTATAVVVGAKP